MNTREKAQEPNGLQEAAERWERIQQMYEASNNELRLAVESLSAFAERTDLALNAAELAWWDWDYRTGNVTFNKNRASLLGFEPEELPTSFGELTAMIHPEDYPAVIGRLEKHLAGELSHYEAEFRLKTKNENWKWFKDKGKVVERDILGKPLRITGMLIDIDKRKVVENELIMARDTAVAESRAKSLFLAGMSHEIYTPMAGVIGMAQILRQSQMSVEQDDYLDAIVKSATNLMSILNDILEYSKLEAGKVEFHDKPFSVAQVVEEVASSMVEKASEKEIEVHSFQDPYLPAEVVGDPVRLRQVLKIFGDNAVKFTERGEVTLEAEFVEWDEATVKVRFIVSDTGIGISEAGMKKLFFSFSRLDSRDSMTEGGGGLGLAIAKQLIERMGGDIKVDSVPGKGTLFSFTVVFDRYTDNEVADSMKGQIGGSKVLLVDDQEVGCRILRNYLQRWDCEVEVSTDPEKALQLFQHQREIKRPFRLVVIENRWEGTDGLTIAARFKPECQLAKAGVLVTAGRSFEATSAQLKDAGVNAFVSKPYTLSRLKSKILMALDGTGQDILTESGGQAISKRVLRILLAEDNPINQKVARITLDRLGHRVDLAENGREALRLFTTEAYDLVLMDIFMPEMDGLEATRKIREYEQDNGRKSVFICAITANSSHEDEERCYEAGMNGFISKPFRLEELSNLLGGV